MTRTDSPGRRPTRARLLGVLLLAAAAAAPATAQFGSYIVPGSLAERREQSRETLFRDLQDARWRWGPLRVEPQLSIGDVGWVDNIYSSSDERAEGDLRAQSSAGLRASMNLGPKVVISGFADANYSWWQNQEQLRNLNESLGLQLLGMFNRLQVQLQGGRVESQRNLSSEVEVPVDLQSDRIELSFDIDARGPLLVFGAASSGRVRYFGEEARRQIPGLTLNTLDRDTDILSIGLRYQFRRGLGIGLGAEQAEAEFEQDAGGRSSKSFGPLLRIDLEGNHLSLDIDVAWRSVEFRGREAEPDREQLTGVGQIGWGVSERLSTMLYASHQLQFSALDPRAAFEGQRSGVSLARTVGRRGRLSFFYEVGDDQFFDITSDRVTRRDDFEAYGAGFELRLSPRLKFNLGFSDSRRDSSNPDFDRDITAVTTRISLGGNLLPW